MSASRRPWSSLPRRAWVVAGVLLLVTAAGVIEALQLMLPGGRMSGALGHPGFFKALFYAVPSWWLLALLIPAGWWLGSRYPIGTGRWNRRLGLHAGASLAFPAVLFALVGLFYGVIDGDLGLAYLRGLMVGLAELYYVYYVFIYWLILGAVHVLHYYRETKDHEIRELTLRSDLSQARLSALRAQLNPHFLFNALNTIAGLALEKGHEEVADAVTELSELLRESLRDVRARLVPLEKELEFTRGYLSLQEHRFGDRLAFDFDVPDELRQALVPAMLLQPLVENSIEHGILPGQGRGTVTVRAAGDGGRLLLEVEDSGPGFPEDRGRGEREGIGLGHTRERLRQLFGADAELSLGRGPAGGARVVVRLPRVSADAPTGEVAGALV